MRQLSHSESMFVLLKAPIELSRNASLWIKKYEKPAEWKMHRKALVLAAIYLTFTITFLTIYLRRPREQVFYLNATVIQETSEKYLSVALDSTLIRKGFLEPGLSRVRFVHLASQLHPAFLRVGGTSSDRLIFDPESSYDPEWLPNGSTSEETFCKPDLTNFTMSGRTWDSINRFASDAGLDLVFDLNVLLRNSSSWNHHNAAQLLAFTETREYSVLWQLGNEPNAFLHVFGTAVSGHQLGQDFLQLRQVLSSFPRLQDSLLVGPDVTRPHFLQMASLQYLADFLRSDGGSADIVSWHQYYLNGRTAQLQDFTNPDTMDVLARQIHAVKEVMDDTGRSSSPMWISETSSAYGGGAPGLSDRFVAGFLWLDKLGLAARLGVSVLVRQSLYHGHYALLDNTLQPNPDWWLSVLYKKLVGTRVLELEPQVGGGGPVRLYAHCANPNMSGPAGAVTLYGLNPGAQDISVRVEWPARCDLSVEVHAYILTGETGLTSQTMLLNGKPLQLHPDGGLPPFTPVVLPDPFFSLPPYSLGFWVLHGRDISACTHNDSRTFRWLPNTTVQTVIS